MKLRIAVAAVWLATGLTSVLAQDPAQCRHSAVALAGGSIRPGMQESRFGDDRQAAEVRVASFRIARFETTNQEFHDWLQENEIPFPYLPELKEKAEREPCYPVENVSWTLAERYCRFRGGRLPSELQWEYAATVDTENDFRQYPWSSGLDYPPVEELSNSPVGISDDVDSVDMDNIETDHLTEEELEALIDRMLAGAGKTSQTLSSEISTVQSSFPGLNGLHGMLGNLWEWTASDYTEVRSDDSKRSGKGLWKVVKGGSYQNVHQPTLMRPTLRNKAKTTEAHSHIGFRCVWY